MARAAIIGGGPAGIVAARYLKSEGFEPVVYEQASAIGGHWSGDARFSAVWPAMRANTSRAMTSFSDLAYPAGTAVYPTNQEVGVYLRRFAALHDLDRHVRLGTRVDRVSRDAPSGEWIVRATAADGTSSVERFDRVVAATGRYHQPSIPDVPGLQSFSGSGGVVHSVAYKDPDRYRGLRVLVAGCAISSLEIASDLAMLGARRVVTTQRRQRYVLQKLASGVPLDHVAFTRFGALAAESFPPEVGAANLKAFILKTSGNPEQVGAPRPAENVFDAGVTLSQHYLPLVAEGRITIKPWITSVSGRTVVFADGSEEVVDAVIFGTGYQLSVPYFDDEIRRTLNVDAQHLDLHAFTFHPDLAGFACIGLFHQIGPYFPVLELQARAIAYTFSGRRPPPGDDEMRQGVEQYRATRHLTQIIPMHISARLFAQQAGVEPDLARRPELARALLFGPLSPISFRLDGPDSLPDAADHVVSAARMFGAVPSLELTAEQTAQLRGLAGARGDGAFAEFVERVTRNQDSALGTRDSDRAGRAGL